jgi:hypothetical protein
MRQHRANIRIILLHMKFHGLTEWCGHDHAPHVFGLHDDTTQVWRVDVRGQITHPPVEVTAGQRCIPERYVVHLETSVRIG